MQVGLSFAFIGCIGGLVQFFAVEPTVRHIGERWAMIVGVGLFLAAQIAFGLAGSALLFLGGHVLLCLGGLGTPAYNAVMSRRVDADRQGEFQGAMGALQGCAGLIGPLVFSGAFAYVTSAGAALPLTGAPFFIGAVLAAGALALTFRGMSRGRRLEDRGAVGLDRRVAGE